MGDKRRHGCVRTRWRIGANILVTKNTLILEENTQLLSPFFHPVCHLACPPPLSTSLRGPSPCGVSALVGRRHRLWPPPSAWPDGPDGGKAALKGITSASVAWPCFWLLVRRQHGIVEAEAISSPLVPSIHTSTTTTAGTTAVLIARRPPPCTA